MINETAEDDIIDVEMIQIATNPQNSDIKKKKKSHDKKLMKEGLKLIQNSLNQTERTMNDLLDLLMGAGSETERRERSKTRDKKKSKRSSSLFGCFGSSSSRK